jgi:hypothetical protein
MTFRQNWDFSEKYMPTIKRILSKHALRFISVEIADEQEDMTQAFDLKISTQRGRVAVRIRRASSKYRDLTIRAYNKGYKTEIHKLRDGFGDWYLYAWEGEGNKIAEYALIDINKARHLFNDDRELRLNKDGGATGFYAYSFEELITCGALIAYERN